MRHLLEVLPGAVLPDTAAESAALGTAVFPPDDDDLVRPIAEEALAVKKKGSLVGGAPGALAKHLLRTFGPLHPALPFPFALRVEIDGDRLVTVDPEVGFLHQGIEKVAEACTPEQLFAIVARANPLRPLALELCTALALEQLMGLTEQVPARARLWRAAALEVARIAEHLHVLSMPGLAPRDKRTRRAVQETARVTAGLVESLSAGGTFARVGGLGRALDADEATRVLLGVRVAAEAARSWLALLDDHGDNADVDDPLRSLAQMNAKVALSFGVGGPALRACGVADDVRNFGGPLDVRSLGFVVKTAEGGDARARNRVRLAEIGVSAEIVRAALLRCDTEAPAIAAERNSGLRPAATFGTGTVEASHGEISVSLFAADDGRFLRVRLRTPSLPLVGVLSHALVGDRIDDVVTALHSIGFQVGEVDR